LVGCDLAVVLTGVVLGVVVGLAEVVGCAEEVVGFTGVVVGWAEEVVTLEELVVA